MGCGPFSSITDVIQLSNEATAVSECRAVCSMDEVPLAAVQGNQLCSCVDTSILEHTFPDRSMCADDSYWHIYAASAVASPDALYEISATIEKLGTKEYVKPYEAVTIHIETNFEIETPFFVDFGDGTVIEISDSEISHFWQSEGIYEIYIETSVGIATISVNTTFTVEDVDEGYEGDFLLLDTYHDKISQVGHIDFTSIDYAKSNCWLLILDNGVELEFKDLEEYVKYNSVVHNFSNFGQFYTNVQCENPYGSMKNRTDFISRKFETTFHFHEKGTNFSTEMAGQLDFYHNLQIDNNDDHLHIDLEPVGHTVTVKPEFLRINENLLTYTFDNITIDKRILHVQNMIGQPHIYSQQLDGAWNLTTNITVMVPPGNNIFLNVSFSEGEDQIFHINYLERAGEIVFEILFPALGYYPVTANISNDISYNSTEVLVSVEVPIRTIAVYAEDITNKESPLVLNIQLNEFMQGPAKANFRVDYDNGNVETYNYYSSTYFFTAYEHEYYYPDWGTYTICVTAFNQISSVEGCITVQIGDKLTYVDITMPSAGRFAVNERMTSIIRCPRGSDKTYVVDFGDEVFIFTDRYLKDTEDFDDLTTTTTSTTTSYVAAHNNAMFSNDTSSENGTTVFTDGAEATTMGTFDANTTDSLLNGTTETVVKRRKRNAQYTDNATESMTSMAPGSESTEEYVGISDSITTVLPGTGDNATSSSSNVTFSSDSYSSNTTGEDNNSTDESVTKKDETTTPVPTTTTIVTTTTMEPIPDDATDPVSSNYSTAQRLRDGTIRVTHRFHSVGIYTVKVRAMNYFNWAKDTLCPRVIVQEEDETSKCEVKELKLSKQFISSLSNPLQFFRSDQVNLTTTAKLQNCKSSVATYSWRTLKIVTEDGRQIQRPHHGDNLCLLEHSDAIFRYPRSSLPFGLYRVILTVSPSGHPLRAKMVDFYMQVNPSAPYAIIDGNEEHQWFLVYATTILRFKESIDPDFNTTDGIEYDMFCMEESDKNKAEKETLDSLKSQSSLLVQGITHRYTSKNKVRLYEFSECFEKSSNFTADVRFPKGEFNVPSEYFVSDVTSFAMGLYVTKNNLTTSAYATFEIRLSNASNLLDQLDDLLASKDTTGVMRAVEALSGLLTTEPVSSTGNTYCRANQE